MVDSATFSEELSKARSFYVKVGAGQNSDRDKAQAEFGLQKCDELLSKLAQNPEPFSEHFLKELFAGIASLFRGVEMFSKFPLEQEHESATIGLVQLKENIKNLVTW